MKHRILFLLALMLTATSWLAAQHAVWWGGSPPPDGTTRDHSVSYGNGFAWQVVLGTAQSEDVAYDAIAVSSGGYLVVGANYYHNTALNNPLVLYRLTEEGDLLWEKGYAMDNYRIMNEFKVVEKSDGGFLVAGKLSYGGVGVPRRCILLDCNANGDTLSTRKWVFADMATDDFKLRKSLFDESYLISYQRNYSGAYLTDVVNLDYNLDTLSISVLPNYRFVPKLFGYICRGGHFENVFYYYLIDSQGEVLDSFPDPFGYLANGMYPVQSLRSGRNAFFRLVLQLPRKFKMATTTDTGEVLHINPRCFSGDDVWWFELIMSSFTPCEFSDGSILVPFNWHFDFYDNEAIGLVKLNSLGELVGDTALTRGAGTMRLVKVLEGGDGRPIVFGTGENGPFGGTPPLDKDIFIAKLETWNPVGVHTPFALGTPALRVYPNPANDTVVVTVPTGVKGTLTVVTLSGQIVHSQPVTEDGALTLSAARWPAGSLVVSLSTPNGVFSTKLIKN